MQGQDDFLVHFMMKANYLSRYLKKIIKNQKSCDAKAATSEMNILQVRYQHRMFTSVYINITFSINKIGCSFKFVRKISLIYVLYFVVVFSFSLLCVCFTFIVLQILIFLQDTHMCS